MGRIKQNTDQVKHFLVFLEMPMGGVKDVTVKASTGEIAGRRALKRYPSALRVHRVERGM